MKTLNYSQPFSLSFHALERSESTPNPDRLMLHPALLLGQIIFSISCLSGALLAEGQPELGGLFTNTYLTYFCVGGSVLGGVLFVILNAVTFKIVESSLARCLKFLGSVIIGVWIVPMLFDYFKLSQNSTTVSFWSILIGLIGWSVLSAVFPLLVKWGSAGVGKATGTTPDSK